MIKFPSINQFRHVKKAVGFAYGSTNTVLQFNGTVKLHGTNAALVVSMSGGEPAITYQSRNNEITTETDNAGFANYMSQIDKSVIIGIASGYLREGVEKVVLFGEWCGSGVQKGVAISELEKMFVIFAVKVFKDDPENGEWADLNPTVGSTAHRIFNSTLFETYSVDIDFNAPEMSVNKLVAITEQVEAECPVGKNFGVSGVGEGVVWRCTDNPTSELWFKVKGEKHSVTKVKKLVEVDTVKLGSIVEFVERVVTDARVKQGIDYLSEQGLDLSRKSTGQFLSWFFADIMKEESDVMEKSGLVKKDVSSRIGEKARGMFFAATDY
jgi:hypothetical protein